MGRRDSERQRSKRVQALALSFAVAATLASAAARAETPRVVTIPSPPARQNRLALVMGLGSPWGELGVSYQRAVGSSFALEMGAGIGATGGQLAVLPKLVVGAGTVRGYFAGGPSLTVNETAGVWAAGEIGLEASFGAFVLTFGGGAGLLVAGSVPSPICFDACSTLRPGRWFPEVRLTLGYAF